ncbi:MAG: isoprenylcysteine carboxylmethyltransferase family protein [Candidatus Aminicenantes bacterium]|nr:isoprenylcysteine carboxylmethyltransferase family protein [Candidatus Aminicenantes bacterium]
MNLEQVVLYGACLWGGAEVISSAWLARRGRQRSSEDRGSLALIYMALAVGFGLAIPLRQMKLGRIGLASPIPELTGLALMVLGIALRVWAMKTLGHFFTYQVKILDDHRLVTAGPFRVLRHPSYTGEFLTLAGIGIGLGSWLSLLLLITPNLAAFVYRIRIEEKALLAHFGEAYKAYQQRTRRLVPFLY